jgi:outer membrane immunogenic protein
MGIKRQLLISTAIGIASMPPAGQAADMPVKAPPPILAPVDPWAGFYIGAHAGYSWGSLSGDTTQTVIVPSTPGFGTPGAILYSGLERNANPQGALGGLQAGYNFRSDALVYGIEADITWTDQTDTFNFSGNKFLISEDFNYQETLAAKLKYMGTVRGRFGYVFGAFLPYVTGGFAFGDLKMSLNTILTQAFCPPCVAAFSGTESHVLFGGTVGAGIEYAFAPRWSAKVEYLFVDLGRQTFFQGVSGGGSFGLTDNIVRAGINFKP